MRAVITTVGETRADWGSGLWRGTKLEALAKAELTRLLLIQHSVKEEKGLCFQPQGQEEGKAMHAWKRGRGDGGSVQKEEHISRSRDQGP